MLGMQRSKSRLKSRLTAQAVDRLSRRSNYLDHQSHQVSHQVKEKLYDYRRLAESYHRHLHLLLIGLLFVLTLGLLVTKTYPDLSIYLIGPINYWPIILLFFLAGFFLLTFITLNTKRGLLLSSALSWLLLFKLQQVEITFTHTIIALIIVVLVENILIFLKKSAQA